MTSQAPEPTSSRVMLVRIRAATVLPASRIFT
jgi:hypothetical protein